MVISASLQACGVVFPFAMPTSICRSIVTICSGLYLLIGMTSYSSKWILSHSTWYKFCRSRQEGLGFVQRLSSQHEGDRIVVRRVDTAVYAARTRPQWPANERPINPAAPFKDAVCGSGWGAARGGHCILKPSVRKRQRYWLSRSVQVEVTCDNYRTSSVVASRIRQDFRQL